MSLLDKLSSYRAEEEKLQWEGTFLDYLPLVKGNPHIAQHAHGGKGVATGLGIFLATEPTVALVMVSFWSLTLLLFLKYLYVASLMGSLVPLMYYSFNHDILTMVCSLIMCLIILLRHRDKFENQEQVKPQIQKV